MNTWNYGPHTCVAETPERMSEALRASRPSLQAAEVMTGQSFQMEPVAYVVGGRVEPTDDHWGGTRSIVRIDGARFGADASAGLDEFSHLEIVFRFHLTDSADLNLGARPARGNPNWPAVGIFGHRDMRRINRLAVSRCRLIKVAGLDLHVEDLDAVDGTPVLDIKPWFVEMGPRGDIRQAPWSVEMLRNYYAPPPHG